MSDLHLHRPVDLNRRWWLSSTSRIVLLKHAMPMWSITDASRVMVHFGLQLGLFDLGPGGQLVEKGASTP